MKSKSDRYSSFRNQLLKEREALHARLARIDGALQAVDGLADAVVTPRRGRLPGAPRRGRPAGKRAKNTMSLKDAVLKVLASGPLTKGDILTAVQKSGYKFTASNPMNSLNVVLYTKGQFKKLPGKRFSPAK
jgi:hypothetical protein